MTDLTRLPVFISLIATRSIIYLIDNAVVTWRAMGTAQCQETPLARRCHWSEYAVQRKTRFEKRWLFVLPESGMCLNETPTPSWSISSDISQGETSLSQVMVTANRKAKHLTELANVSGVSGVASGARMIGHLWGATA